MTSEKAHELLDLWFDPRHKQRWFESTADFDRELAERFAGPHRDAMVGEHDAWAETAEGLLALVILLDQVPRNIYRGTPKAFASDARALALATDGIDRGIDDDFSIDQRLFLYLPLEHAEDLAVQERSVALFRSLGDENYLDYAIRHRDIIARFGRFPHRNAILGRKSTAEELRFLEEPGSSF